MLLKLTICFLKNHSFRVNMYNSLFIARPALAQIPHGFYLSSLLYLVYINNIPLAPKASIALFADNTIFFTKNWNPTRAIMQLQKQINLTTEWFEKRHLRITVTILFSQRKLHLQCISLNGYPIDWSPNAKYLGIYFDQLIKFHVKSLIKKTKKNHVSCYTRS